MQKQSKKVIIGITIFALTAAGIYWLGPTGGEKKESINKEVIKPAENKNTESEDKNSGEKKEEKPEFTEYQNQAYRYSLKFSGKWKMNNDYSERKLEQKEINDEFDMAIGGQTFWSNYTDINKYNPGNRPKDFRLLALTVYQDKEKNITTEKFAEKLGFEKEITEAVSFDNENIQGREVVSPGSEKGKPRIAVIFQKEDFFYVFNLAFAENKETVEEMEGIVKTFWLTN